MPSTSTPNTTTNNNNNNNVFVLPPTYAVGGEVFSISLGDSDSEEEYDDTDDDEMPPLQEEPTVASARARAPSATAFATPQQQSSSNNNNNGDHGGLRRLRPSSSSSRSSRSSRGRVETPTLSTNSLRRIVRAIRPPNSNTSTDDEEEEEEEEESETSNNRPAARPTSPSSRNNNHNNNTSRSSNNNENRFTILEDGDDEEEDDDDDDEDDNGEIMSYHSSDSDDSGNDYDDDDDDDDSGDSNGMPPPELMDLFRVVSHFVEQHDSDDDDDDSNCACQHCLLERFGLDDDQGDDEEESDSEKETTTTTASDPHTTGTTRLTCAVCMEYESISRKRQFVELPCCGVQGRDLSSSTRFCRSCLIQYMTKSGIPLPPISNPNNHRSGGSGSGSGSSSGFVSSHNNNIHELMELEIVGECPRCKHLLVLTASLNSDKNSNNNNDNTRHNRHYTNSNSKKKKKKQKQNKTTNDVQHIITKASVRHMIWYIGGKEGGSYRPHLLTMAYCNPYYIPTELLLNDTSSENKIVHLCQWGILQKKGICAAAAAEGAEQSKGIIATTMTNLFFFFFMSSSSSSSTTATSLSMSRRLQRWWNDNNNIIKRIWRRMKIPLKVFLRTKIGLNIAWTNTDTATTASNTHNHGHFHDHLHHHRHLHHNHLHQHHHHHHVRDHEHDHDDHRDHFMETIHSQNAKDSAETIYRLLNYNVQYEMFTLLTTFLEIDSDDDLVMRTSRIIQDREENSKKQCFVVCLNCAASGWMAISQFRFVRAVRIWNRGITLAILASGKVLPWLGSWPMSTTTTTNENDQITTKKHSYCWTATTYLNIFFIFVLLKILGKLFWVLYYLMQAYSISIIIGMYIVPPSEEWKRNFRNGFVTFVIFHRSYLLYHSYYFQSLWFSSVAMTSDNITGELSESVGSETQQQYHMGAEEL